MVVVATAAWFMAVAVAVTAGKITGRWNIHTHTHIMNDGKVSKKKVFILRLLLNGKINEAKSLKLDILKLIAIL